MQAERSNVPDPIAFMNFVLGVGRPMGDEVGEGPSISKKGCRHWIYFGKNGLPSNTEELDVVLDEVSGKLGGYERVIGMENKIEMLFR